MGDADKNRVGFSNIRGGLEPRLVRVRGGVGLTDAGPPPTPLAHLTVSADAKESSFYSLGLLFCFV